MSASGTYAPGDYVPSHFNGSIVAASYFASLCGTLLTIELLHRRGTALNNLRSWLENFACAVSFGVMGIWCMHFIGNRAIILDDGREELQLVSSCAWLRTHKLTFPIRYAPGFTTLSVFLPIIGLTLAFAAAEFPTKSGLHHWLALSGTGIFAGLSIVGMHYVGNLGVTNYNLHYIRSYFAASIIIAIGDCLGVLVLFYTWRDKWISATWKRLFCAFFLAGGVSAMHFTASVGCNYQFKTKNEPGALQRTNVQVIVASVLCGAAAIVVLCAIFLTRYGLWLRRQRAKKVMLACAIFNQDGRILVTTEGVLPAHEITDKYNTASFSETFDTAHPVFHWIFRVSYHWASVADLIPRMKGHLSKAEGEIGAFSQPVSSASSTIYDSSTYSDYTVLFRERFCVAASNLASSLHVPMDKIGVLYDKIIDTGTFAEERRIRRKIRSHEDVEVGVRKVMTFGRGQALVLVSHISPDDEVKLLNAGYKFATVPNVSKTIADSLQIPVSVVENHCNDLLRYIVNLESLDKPGTWLSFFAPVPVPHTSGFDIAVSNFDRNQLPDAQILQEPPTQWQCRILDALDGKKSGACARYLDALQRNLRSDLKEREFATNLLSAFRRVAHKVPKEWWTEAYFYSKSLHVPYSCILTGDGSSTILYAFVVIGDAHTVTSGIDSMVKVPLSFFSLRQRCFRFSRDHQIMAREIHQEFGAILGRKSQPEKKLRRSLSRHWLPKWGRDVRNSSIPQDSELCDRSIAPTESSSDNGVIASKGQGTIAIERSLSDNDLFERRNIYGGILVDSETVVRTDYREQHPGHNVKDAIMGLGAVADATRDKQEDTFVDELLHVALNRFLPPKPGY